jgi:hypothetical protein
MVLDGLPRVLSLILEELLFLLSDPLQDLLGGRVHVDVPPRHDPVAEVAMQAALGRDETGQGAGVALTNHGRRRFLHQFTVAEQGLAHRVGRVQFFDLFPPLGQGLLQPGTDGFGVSPVSRIQVQVVAAHPPVGGAERFQLRDQTRSNHAFMDSNRMGH